MSKTSELALVIEELRNAAAALCSVAENLSTLLADQAEQSTTPTQTLQKAEKPLTLEAVRAVLAEKSRNGHTAYIRALLEKHGAAKLSEIDPAKYAALMADVEALGNG